MKCFLDTETCGFHGLAVLLQYAFDDGPIILYDLWKKPAGETLELIEKIADCEVVGFNLAFDWFHLCKIYTLFRLLDPDDYPEDNIEKLALLEPQAREGPCLKPRSACDLMLHARKGPYQSLMDRKDIRIRRVPKAIAQNLADELERRVKIDDIYFARRKDKFAPRWKIYEIKYKGQLDPDFVDVCLKFHASGGLKNLAIHALGVEEDSILKFTDVAVDEVHRPAEVGWAPFALALGKPSDWKHTWPEVIGFHINYWAHNPLARKYGGNDVDYTRRLYYHFGSPQPGDNDSVLACMVGAVRWRGFKINAEKIKELRRKAIALASTAPRDPKRVLDYLLPVLDKTEQLALLDRQGNMSTKKTILESISRWLLDDGKPHPAAVRALEIIRARKAKKRVEVLDKLLQAGRFHASFVVIGTLSSRMAGSDGLNPQGIDRTKEMRACFDLADEGFQLCGGDFESFEVVLADAVYNDENLRRDLTTLVPCDKCKGSGKCGKCLGVGCPKCKSSGVCGECKGTGQVTKKIHALFAMELYPGSSYDDIMATKGTEDDRYGKGKSGVFSQIYGGDENTISTKLGIDIDTAKAAAASFQKKYPGIGLARRRIFDAFCSMRQPGGIGSKVIWKEPADYVESFLGFRRYFTLENQICKALFDLANHMPKTWKDDFPMKVVRRERQQTAAGALCSALYGAAFQIQAANMRAGANHEIQNPGSLITKTVQRNVWDVQPHGVNEWRVVPMNVHDEVMAPTKPEAVKEVREAVTRTVESFRDKVPLIAIDWSDKLETWASK